MFLTYRLYAFTASGITVASISYGFQHGTHYKVSPLNVPL